MSEINLCGQECVLQGTLRLSDAMRNSILDFANIIALFQEYNVEFISSTEKFDTSTPMSRAMLNICIVFAQLERHTIQKRVQDAWYAWCQRGFKVGWSSAL